MTFEIFFGVAVLGSLSSMLYRVFLDISSFSSKGIVRFSSCS